MRYHARKRFDIDAGAFVGALAVAATARDTQRPHARLVASWGETAVPALSVRTAFDALLGVVDWPPGSEVLMSAVTIPHMAEIVRMHGYVAVAVDIDPRTGEVAVDTLRAQFNERARAIVVAHLFGARNETDALRDFARAHGLLFVEDCAQCYGGAPASSRADVALYSFGSIKTTTCLGGAIALVADPDLRAAVVSRLARYPVQSRATYLLKLCKYVLLQLLATPTLFAALRAVLDAALGDYDAVLRRWTRGFPDDDLLRAIRRRPSSALLAVMALRLCAARTATVGARAAAGTRFTARLGSEVRVATPNAAGHTYWLYPVVARDAAALIAAARAVGFDATAGSSTLVAISPTAEHAAAMMRSVVYLPVSETIPARDLDRLADTVTACERGELHPAARDHSAANLSPTP